MSNSFFIDSKDKADAEKYSVAEFDNTYYLGYRDIPSILQKYVKGKKAVDYGCGTGRSTRFLKKLGFETLGVDINREMLLKAISMDCSHYLHIQSSKIPILGESVDLFFSCFVMLTISSKKELLAIFKEIRRCLKEDGIFVMVTASEFLYTSKWLSYNVDFPENKSLLSGDPARIELKDLGIEFPNYFWTDKDYKDLFFEAGLSLLDTHFPLGTMQDDQKWLSESEQPPYSIYVVTPSSQ